VKQEEEEGRVWRKEDKVVQMMGLAGALVPGWHRPWDCAVPHRSSPPPLPSPSHA
jgi:hypothetical protein